MALTRYTDGDIVVSTDKVITSTWTNNTNNLTDHFTSSRQGGQEAGFTSPTSSGQFYVDVLQELSSSATAEVQYAVAYGNRVGSGSPDFTNDTGSFGVGASRAVYNQYRQLVFGDEGQDFTFSSHTPDDFYVINVNRSRFKHALKPGTLNLHISGGIGDGANMTGPLKLTDDSVTATGSAVITNLGRQFNLVSGSNGLVSGSNINQKGNSSSYGLFYPDAGIIILNPDNFDSGIIPARNSGLSTNTDRNHVTLARHIKDASSAGVGNFILDSEEKVTSQYYFTRAKNNEYNYTTNPSFQDESGNLNFTSMIDNPQTYITTVGLYNDSNDLVAVAKLSQPVTKDFTKEALIRVKLDY